MSAAILLASGAQAESFIEDSSLNIHLRNYYKTDKRTNTQKQSAWSQGIRAEFSSGYFMNMIGFDASWYTAIKLSGDKNKADVGLLRIKGNDKKAHSYSKVGGAVKINLMDMATVKYGRMYIDTPLLNDSDSRNVPSLTEALMAEGEFGAARLYGIHARENSARVESGYESYGVYDSNGKHKKQAVNIIGGGYNFGDGFSVIAAYGQQKEFGSQFYTDALYEMPINDEMSMSLGAQYGTKKMKGDAQDNAVANKLVPTGQQLDKDTIYFWGINAGMTMGNLSLGLSYTDVDQPTSNTKTGLNTASMAWGSGENDGDMQNSGFMGYNAIAYSDFNRAGQSAWGINVGYNFSDMVEGLSSSVVYVDSTIDMGKSGVRDQKEKEYNIKVNYALPVVDGLSVDLVHAKNTARNSARVETVNKESRVIIKYDVAIF
ncbi:OprD family outer membrane porin [Endozoicomonadaceae bacterium StTr2]